MRYILIDPLHNNQKIAISYEQFEQIKSGQKFLLEALSIEESFNLILENYAEFELELLNSTMRKTIFHQSDWSSTVDEIYSINRRIINLLTTSRLYKDHVCHSICVIYGSESDQKKAFEKMLRDEYDSVFGYRVMEAMRNYVQHRGLPIKGIEWKNRWGEEPKDKNFRKHTIRLNIDVEQLSQDTKLKKSVLSELRNQRSLVGFTPLIRDYVESFGKVHVKIRKSLQPDLVKWENDISQAFTLYEASTNEKVNNLLRVLTLADDSNVIEEEVQIFDDFIKRRQMLERKNEYPHYSAFYVSSEAPEIH